MALDYEEHKLTKNKHAAAINNSRVVISGSRWSSSGEGSVRYIIPGDSVILCSLYVHNL